MSSVILDSVGLGRTISRMAHEIAERNPDPSRLMVVGVQRGGVHLGQRLVRHLEALLGCTLPVGVLDVSMHRDDLAQRSGLELRPTRLPAGLDGLTVVLVDDVLYTGRTTRAALDALNAFGRPDRVQLAVLVDRGHRQLPIKADFVGKNVPTHPSQRIDVQWSEDGREDRVVLEGEAA
ncbi:MAG: bifunctional pyr operon transcriptional regulator/uracil phosphoribosyltransferase PyrR [Verrucomicrobiota bacterium]